MFCYIELYYIMFYYIVFGYFMLYHIMLYSIMLYYVSYFNVMLCYVMSYYLILYHEISFIYIISDHVIYHCISSISCIESHYIYIYIYMYIYIYSMHIYHFTILHCTIQIQIILRQYNLVIFCHTTVVPTLNIVYRSPTWPQVQRDLGCRKILRSPRKMLHDALLKAASCCAGVNSHPISR